MNRNILKIGLMATLGFAASLSACKKDDKKSSSTAATSTWTIDGKTYTSVSSALGDNAYGFGSMDLSSVTFYFKSIPTASQTYTLHGSMDDDLFVTAGTNSPMMTASATSGTVNVTVSDGKVRMQMTDAVIEESDGSGKTTGNGKLSADVTYGK